jgi:hypothetical protein
LQATVTPSNLKSEGITIYSIAKQHFRSAAQPPPTTWREVIGGSNGALLRQKGESGEHILSAKNDE